jgi:hypothetical protein
VACNRASLTKCGRDDVAIDNSNEFTIVTIMMKRTCQAMKNTCIL